MTHTVRKFLILTAFPTLFLMTSCKNRLSSSTANAAPALGSQFLSLETQQLDQVFSAAIDFYVQSLSINRFATATVENFEGYRASGLRLAEIGNRLRLVAISRLRENFTSANQELIEQNSITDDIDINFTRSSLTVLFGFRRNPDSQRDYVITFTFYPPAGQTFTRSSSGTENVRCVAGVTAYGPAGPQFVMQARCRS